MVIPTYLAVPSGASSEVMFDCDRIIGGNLLFRFECERFFDSKYLVAVLPKPKRGVCVELAFVEP